MATPILIGLGIATAAYGSRSLIMAYKTHGHHLSKIKFPSVNMAGLGALGANAKYYRGGFETKMSRREALLVLGLRDGSVSKDKVKEAHRRIMLLNHPDRGGSPFLASKINEAKDLLDRTVRR